MRSPRRTAFVGFALMATAATVARAETSRFEVVTLESPGSPLVALRLFFEVGSMHDPAGKEGLAALTGMMVANAGTAQRSYG
ncbi:MAG: hypothetical protein ACRD0X_00225, partial [Thermoanaerobaculia bacterium]